MDRIDKIIDEVIKELEIGIVKTNINLYMKVHSNTSSHFEIIPTLNLNNKDEFYSIVKSYLCKYTYKLYSFDDVDDIKTTRPYKIVKNKIAFLFANMSFDDFNNPVAYVKRVIDFKQNKLLERKTLDYIESLKSKIHINIKESSHETPYCFECSLISDGGYYPLPIISYGISDDTCYVYAIQNMKKDKSDFEKKFERKLYKLNKNVMDFETEEYKDYKLGKSDYYPENISDVSNASILALTIFLNEVEKYGIHKIKVIPYLPVRFDNRIKTSAYSVSLEKDLTEQQKREEYLRIIKYQMYIQSNITEKFIRTFNRVAYHFPNVKITSFPMELDDGLHINLSKFEYSNNVILNEVINANKIDITCKK